jgi:DNA-binding response OmpR family regulator
MSYEEPASFSKVLIVDDEPAIADTLQTIFSEALYEARAVYSAQQAIDEAKEWSPDLVIVDVILPCMNGIDLAVLLHALCPDARVLLFSGQTAASDLLDQARKGGNQFDMVPGPLDSHALVNFASRLLFPGCEA